MFFEGAIADFPSPDVEKDNVNYLAGIREIGVRSEFTDGRDMPRLLVRSVEFEGPLLSSWPPREHQQIFVESTSREDAPRYAQEIIESFMRKAYRRPVHAQELELVKSVWSTSFAENHDFAASIKDALLVVLTSPQFLFLIEKSAGPESELLEEYELASKLSYFLWDSPPDEALLERAATGTLHASLVDETERMMRDPRFELFLSQFVKQWLSLEKLDVVETDLKRFPQLTREMKQQLGEEPIRFVAHLIEHNLPVSNLVRSDFIVANDPIATYYALGDRTESGFDFKAIPLADHSQAGSLGGLLGQAGILAGLSDGRESNPVKRGAWFARKIIADPPDDPPPNVPELKEDSDEKLTLRERLEMHRNQEGCAKCHSGIDPWGVPFEAFDAAGKVKAELPDTRSRLPDGTEVNDFIGLKNYLADEKVDRVAFSFMKHLASYATGRTLTYNETVFLEEEVARLKPTGYPMRDLFKLIVQSDLFLKK